MVRIKEEIEEGSSKQPELGVRVPGNTTTEPYSAPASISMVDVLSKPCAGENCLKGPVFGVKGGKQAIFRADHAMAGMIDIAKSTFGREGTRKRPSSWVADAGNVQFDGGDAPDWLENVTVANWKFSREGSPIAPNHSSANYSKEEGFAEHTPGEMGAEDYLPCAPESCLKEANYGAVGSRQSHRRALHAVGGIGTVSSNKCRRESCSEMPSYSCNVSKGTDVCVRDANDGMVAVPVANEESFLREGSWRPRSGGLGAKGSQNSASYTPRAGRLVPRGSIAVRKGAWRCHRTGFRHLKEGILCQAPFGRDAGHHTHTMCQQRLLEVAHLHVRGNPRKEVMSQAYGTRDGSRPPHRMRPR